MAGEIMYNVPIFPLGTVLFPSMPLPLHIFEERYVTMLNDLQDGDRRFCVAHIVDGREVGGSADTSEVACLAEIIHLQSLPDERFFLVAVGTERVRILSTDPIRKPYLTGAVETWPEQDVTADAATVQRARKLLDQYLECLRVLTGEEGESITMPEEADLLSYIVAVSLQIEPEEKQKLLEVPGSAERLKLEVGLLQNELPVLRALMSGSAPPEAGYGSFSAN